MDPPPPIQYLTVLWRRVCSVVPSRVPRRDAVVLTDGPV